MTSAKAIVAAISAGLTAAIGALTVVLVGDMTLSELTQAQWLAVGGATLAAVLSAGGLTWSTTNAPATTPSE